MSQTRSIIFIRVLLLVMIWAVSGLVVSAQDTEVGIPYGTTITGQINNQNPRDAYFFEGMRCDFLSLQVRATSGNLDLVVTILDDTGTPIFSRDDSPGSTDVIFEPLAIPRTGRYYVVVGRFGYGLGSTSGSYEVLIERIGNGSASGCALRYGDTVENSITNAEPAVFYSFRARQGDIITVRMRHRSGNLDPFLKIVDINDVILDFNDDIPGSGTQDAEIRSLVIPADGTYFIIATRYGEVAGTTTGNFVLTLQESDGSGLGISPETALTISSGQTLENALTASVFEQYYRFEGRENDVISISMDRLGDDLTPYIVLADSELRGLVVDGEAGRTAARLQDVRLPYSGTYYIMAGRVGRAEGTTLGRYRLNMVNAGNAFSGVPEDIRQVNYGMTLSGLLDDATPEINYAFWGAAGETVLLTMTRTAGDFTPLVRLLSDDGETVVASDIGASAPAQIERFTLTRTGIYYIQATRYASEGASPGAGSYSLVFAQRFD